LYSSAPSVEIFPISVGSCQIVEGVDADGWWFLHERDTHRYTCGERAKLLEALDLLEWMRR
jgi:hypothetical protein